DGDLLGRALGVKQFTILEAIGLFQRSCTLVPDSCIRMIRHVEPRQGTGLGDHNMVREADEDQSVPVGSTVASVPGQASSGTERSTYRESVSVPDSSSQSCLEVESIPHLSSSDTSSGRLQSSIVMTPPASQETSYSTTDCSMTTLSSTASQESTSCNSHSDLTSSFGSQDIGPSVSQTASQELSQRSPSSQPTSSFSSSASSTSAVINFKASKSSVTVSDCDLRSPQCDQQYSIDSDGSSKERNKSTTRHTRSSLRRGPGTSIDVLLDEPDGNSGPWECSVRVHTGHSAANLNGSALGNIDDETVVVEYESDQFSVEYELASSSSDEQEGGDSPVKETSDRGGRDRSVSETSSHSSGLGTGTAMLVVCKESDVEYLADYSDTDTGSDAELSEGDKWVCSYCSVRNPPFQRNCGGCWAVRFDWLPTSNHGTKSAISETGQVVVHRDKTEVIKSQDRTETEMIEQGIVSQDPSEGSKAGCSGQPIDSTSSVVERTRVSPKEEDGASTITSSSDDGPKVSLQASGKASRDFRHNSQNKSQSSPVAGADLNSLKAEAFKAIAAASKLRAKKRHYSSGLSTSDSQDDCLKSKSEPHEIVDDMNSKGTKPESGDTSVKSSLAKDQPLTRPKKQKPSFYSERTLGVLSKNEACVVCLVRPKTASIIHGKTGHQVCCYHCAKKLKKQRRACPICRRPIQKVIRNYHL
ncbi:hypothetical protein EGW08_010930, partial [Elysia chlorotica]